MWDDENNRVLEFLTNTHHLAASAVAAIHKDRWRVELFSKALKQNLKVKTQIWAAVNQGIRLDAGCRRS